jgi:hypothetical protein
LIADIFSHQLQGGLQTLLKYIKENDPDKLSIALASSLDTIGELELLQVPQQTDKLLDRI